MIFFRFGIIPIFVKEPGQDATELFPFSEVLDWGRAVLKTSPLGLRVKETVL